MWHIKYLKISTQEKPTMPIYKILQDQELIMLINSIEQVILRK